MKTFLRCAVLASILLAPAAFSQDSDKVQACVNEFVAQHFPGQSPEIKVEQDNWTRQPLMVSKPRFGMTLTAADRASGRVLVTATCVEKNGTVVLQSASVKSLIAAR